MDIVHKPVMLNEVMRFLSPKNGDELFIDSTMGEGGHSIEFLKKYPYLNVIGLDRDKNIQEIAKERLSPYNDRVVFYNIWFDDFFLNYPADLKKPNLILFDLGISCYHYEKSGRGFSFFDNDRLDMRLNLDQELSALDIVNSYSCEDIANIIYNYGEERFSRVIARNICEYRKKNKIETSLELANIIKRSVPASYEKGRIHPATRSFQALRIAVNGEIDRIKRGIGAAYSVLAEGGVMAIISFHSLEDRVVKDFIKKKVEENIVEKNKYKKNCGVLLKAENLTKKPVVATVEEISSNAPSRSAKLRSIKKLKDE